MISSSGGDQGRETNQRRLLSLLEARKIEYETLDGADPEVKEMRDTLFKISSLRGAYPQCFLRGADGSHTFIGDWDAMEVSLTHACSLIEYILLILILITNNQHNNVTFRINVTHE
jgi:hypothetical protein